MKINEQLVPLATDEPGTVAQAGEISSAAPVLLLFFLFLMFIITTLRDIDLLPMNYFFLATAFFAFSSAACVSGGSHISIHAAMAISSIVSVLLVVSYLRLVVGLCFAALRVGTAHLVYLVLFSYAFFWRGFTGLSITIIAIITLFEVTQATGRIRWSQRFAPRSHKPLPNSP